MSLSAPARLTRRGAGAAGPSALRLAGQALDWLLPLAALVGGVLVSIARSPIWLRHPEVYAEDGRVWFADAYNQGWFRPLTEPHTGYLQTFPRLVAGVGLLLPLGDLPRLFADVAVAVQVLPAALIVSRRFERLIPSRLVRVGCAALYLALPNSREMNANLTNAQWHLALLALLALLAAPGGLAWRAFDLLVVGLSGLTGPFGIALAAVAVVAVVARRQRWTLVLFLETGLCAAIQLFELVDLDRGKYAGLGADWKRFAEIFGSEIVGGTFLGQATQYPTLAGPHALATAELLLLGGALLVLAALAFGPLELRLLNGYAGLVVGASLLDPVASVRKAQWLALALDPQMRYWFFPAVALLADAVWLATAAGRRASRSSASRSSPSRASSARTRTGATGP